MSEWNIALGALIIVLAIAGGALLSRWHVAPMTGPTDVGWCPAEQRERLHAYSRDGRRCWVCRTFTPSGPPAGGAR